MADSEETTAPASAADRSRNRSIGRLDKHFNELSAAVEVWGPSAGMTYAERTAVTSTLSQLSDTLWARKKAADDDARSREDDV
jgi:hypothetical protein